MPQPKRLAAAPAVIAAAAEVPVRVVMGVSLPWLSADGRAKDVDARSGQLRFDDLIGSKAAAGVDVDASGGRIIGAYGNGKPGVAGNSDGAVGIGTQKDGFLGNHSLYRKPHMEGSP